MSIENKVSGFIEEIKKNTVDYRPTPNNLEDNRNKSVIGLASVGALYVLPGDYQLLSSIALIYTGLKGYQAVRDWAGK